MTQPAPSLRLGIMGLSEGNGHPYSWSAICNGYDPAAMADCPFPVIPRYLARQSFPAARLPDARVTHVWTQDPEISRQVARAALIPNVVADPGEMLGQVDGILLARDDAENHRRFAEPFIGAGLPVYIDKPLALSRAAAVELFGLERYPGQVFSCSALRYAPELQLTARQRQQVGAVHLVEGSVPKSWARYAVHVIEPILAGFPQADHLQQAQRLQHGEATELWVSWVSGLQTRFTSTGCAASPIEITVHGRAGTARLRFRRPFQAFRAALAAFVAAARARRAALAAEETLRVVDLIEKGCGPSHSRSPS